MTTATIMLADEAMQIAETRGLRPETVRAAGLRRVTASEISREFGVEVPCGGILIPYGDGNGARVRLDRLFRAPGWQKPAKYLSRPRAGNRLYIPPTLPPGTLEGTGALVLTEGEFKALRACEEGIPCIATAGIWSWKTRGPNGERLDDDEGLLPDFDRIRWADRELVVLVFDSDITPNHPGYPAYRRLAAQLVRRGARRVKILTLPTDGKSKVGLDDFLATHSADDFWRLVEAAPDFQVKRVGSYAISRGRIVRERLTKDGLIEEVLGHFTARIVEEVVEDDGAERVRRFVIEGELPDGRPLPTVAVAASEFAGMGWVTREWGTRAIVTAGSSVKDALREAIQHLSGEPPVRHIYTHAGWRRIDGRWVFLHGGGAIGVDGVETRLPERLARYSLPPPPTDPETVRQALRAVLRMREVWRGNPAAGWALLAATWRAPLGALVPATVTVWIYGQSGAHKTTTATLAVSQYGDFDASTPPETWISTDNAIEQSLWLAADLPLLIDDFAPSRARDDAESMRRTAERVIRRVGNHTGRGRLRADLTAAPDRPPRALPIVTAEEMPIGRLSALARLFLVPVERGQVDLAALSAMQAQRALLRLGGAAYLEWLRRRMDAEPGLAAAIREQQEQLRAEVLRGGHPRVADNVAVLLVGVKVWLAFAVEAGAITEHEARALWQEALNALVAVAEEQASLLECESPELSLLEAIAQLVGSGQLGLAPLGQPAPEGRKLVGWYDPRYVYLLRDVAFKEAEHLLSRGRGIAASPQAIWRALEQRG
ncbi:MAG TPA: DUF3854 domain-containing protein, partial [Bacillota bacterium]